MGLNTQPKLHHATTTAVQRTSCHSAAAAEDIMPLRCCCRGHHATTRNVQNTIMYYAPTNAAEDIMPLHCCVQVQDMLLLCRIHHATTSAVQRTSCYDHSLLCRYTPRFSKGPLEQENPTTPLGRGDSYSLPPRPLAQQKQSAPVTHHVHRHGCPRSIEWSPPGQPSPAVHVHALLDSG